VAARVRRDEPVEEAQRDALAPADDVAENVYELGCEEGEKLLDERVPSVHETPEKKNERKKNKRKKNKRKKNKRKKNKRKKEKAKKRKSKKAKKKKEKRKKNPKKKKKEKRKKAFHYIIHY
jgi:hypothetical protein